MQTSQNRPRLNCTSISCKKTKGIVHMNHQDDVPVLPEQTASYVGLCNCPCVYPTSVWVTPGTRWYASSTPQKHPAPKQANWFPLAGLSISGPSEIATSAGLYEEARRELKPSMLKKLSMAHKMNTPSSSRTLLYLKHSLKAILSLHEQKWRFGMRARRRGKKVLCWITRAVRCGRNYKPLHYITFQNFHIHFSWERDLALLVTR